MTRYAMAATLATAVMLCAFHASHAAEEGAAPAPSSFVIVELFTSEGCSSCPPADELLIKIAAEAKAKGQPVYALAYHVDYWNRLGWVDKLSDKAYSKRQEDYAQALQLRQVYTPQMIVNGREQFLGSDAEAAKKAIDEAVARKPDSTLTLNAEALGKDSVRVSFQVTQAPARAVLNVAIVEQGLETKVLRGENAGRTLKHAGVVRVFQTVDLAADGKGTLDLKIPPAVVRKNATIIAFMQTPNDMAVHVGASVAIP
ncbi:MAG: hypothetical protein JWP03_1512 [Phycisphaerales bacterium]|jgi:hypothetical protein|nr:hypothetical protein [Phycisphaerales bacterium]